MENCNEHCPSSESGVAWVSLVNWVNILTASGRKIVPEQKFWVAHVNRWLLTSSQWTAVSHHRSDRQVLPSQLKDPKLQVQSPVNVAGSSTLIQHKSPHWVWKCFCFQTSVPLRLLGLKKIGCHTSHKWSTLLCNYFVMFKSCDFHCHSLIIVLISSAE